MEDLATQQTGKNVPFLSHSMEDPTAPAPQPRILVTTTALLGVLHQHTVTVLGMIQELQVTKTLGDTVTKTHQKRGVHAAELLLENPAFSLSTIWELHTTHARVMGGAPSEWTAPGTW